MQVRGIANKLSGTYLAKSGARTVVRVDVGGDLEDEASELGLLWLHETLLSLSATGRWSNLHKTIEQFLHTKVVEGGTEEHRSQLTCQVVIDIELGIHTVNQFQVLAQLRGIILTYTLIKIVTGNADLG